MPTSTSILERICPACKTAKPVSDFDKARPKRTGHEIPCKACRTASRKRAWHQRRKQLPDFKSLKRNNTLRSNYGITQSDYDALLTQQGGCCAICKSTSSGGRWSTFHVDHDHVTGKVRGLLCHHCNVTLGRMGDNLEGVMKFVAYLGG